MNKPTQIILNIFVGILSLLIFLVLLFPADAAISHFLANLEKQSGKDGWRIAVANVDASLFFDTHFENLRVYKGNDEVFSAPKVSVGFSMFPLLFGSVNASFKAKYPAGSITGQIVLKSESVIDININDVPLEKVGFINKLGLPLALEGVLKGNLYYYWTGDPRNMEAEVNLKLADAKAKSLSIKDLNLELTDVVFSEGKNVAEVDAVFKAGQLTINKFNFPGPDLSFSLSGKARMGTRNEVSRILMDGKLAFSDKINSKVSVLEMIKGFQSEDGSYAFAFRGNSKAPKITIGDFDLCQVVSCQKLFPQAGK